MAWYYTVQSKSGMAVEYEKGKVASVPSYKIRGPFTSGQELVERLTDDVRANDGNGNLFAVYNYNPLGLF